MISSRPNYLRKRCRTAMVILVLFTSRRALPQALPIGVTADRDHHTVTITVDGDPFTTFIYPDTLEKPVLYPIYAPDGQLITRGFPLSPRPGEPTDHPHHLGLCVTDEHVNGL